MIGYGTDYGKEFENTLSPLSTREKRKRFQRFYREFQRYLAIFEVFGSSQFLMEDMCFTYTEHRSYARMRPKQLEKMRPYIKSVAEFFPQIVTVPDGNIIGIEAVIAMQRMKDLYNLAEEYPELHEVLLYSKQAVKFYDYIGISPHLDWYNLAEGVTHIQGVDIANARRLHIEKEAAEHRAQYRKPKPPRPDDQDPLLFGLYDADSD